MSALTETRLLILVLVFALPVSTMAGSLYDFERDAAKREQRTNTPSSTTNSKDDDDDIASGCLEGFMDDCLSDMCTSGPVSDAIGALFSGIAAGGRQSWDRADSTGSDIPGRTGALSRKPGDALIPFSRFDISYQNVESDVTAWDYRFELGFGPLGIQVRRTLYDETDPVASLEVEQYHVLYRMSFGSQVEVDAGFGTFVLNGMQENSGFSMTVPVLYHPSALYGFEFRPVWSSINENDIQDFDLSMLFGWRYASVRAGYRWLRSPNQSLDGPHIGVSLRW